jgi:hypothetical protein
MVFLVFLSEHHWMSGGFLAVTLVQTKMTEKNLFFWGV